MAPKVAFPTRPTTKVTEAEIEHAIVNDSGHCMIADALRREYSDAIHILVDVRTTRMTDPIRKKRYTWLTPYEAARFLVRWDQGIRPPEFHVRLRTPIAVTEARRLRRGESSSAKGITRDGTVLGGKPTAVGLLAGRPRLKKDNKQRPPAASRQRGFGIRVMDEKAAPEL